jgi:hypothetical protein
MSKELREYIEQVKAGFINDPADSDYQRGYLTAILHIEEFLEGANQ